MKNLKLIYLIPIALFFMIWGIIEITSPFSTSFLSDKAIIACRAISAVLLFGMLIFQKPSHKKESGKRKLRALFIVIFLFGNILSFVRLISPFTNSSLLAFVIWFCLVCAIGSATGRINFTHRNHS